MVGDYGLVDLVVVIVDMEVFFDVGIMLFDCVDIYIGVEEMIGIFIVDVCKCCGLDVVD